MTEADRRRLTVMGEALIDFVPTQDDAARFAALSGGSGFNTAIGLARLDVPTAFCGPLSKDPLGRRLFDALRDAGVSIEGVLDSELPCPVVIVQPDGANGAPAYALHLANTALDTAPDAFALAPDVLHVHATSFACTIGAGGVAALATLQAAREFASTSFDPNIRAAILPARDATRALIEARVALADIVKVSREDLHALGVDDQAALARDWLARGVRIVVVTDGADGATAFFDAQSRAVAAPRIVLRDSVGAGDSFMAAFLAGLSTRGLLGPALRARETALDAETLGDALAFAARAAAITCTRAGADPPHSAEVASGCETA